MTDSQLQIIAGIIGNILAVAMAYLAYLKAKEAKDTGQEVKDQYNAGHRAVTERLKVIDAKATAVANSVGTSALSPMEQQSERADADRVAEQSQFPAPTSCACGHPWSSHGPGGCGVLIDKPGDPTRQVSCPCMATRPPLRPQRSSSTAPPTCRDCGHPWSDHSSTGCLAAVPVGGGVGAQRCLCIRTGPYD